MLDEVPCKHLLIYLRSFCYTPVFSEQKYLQGIKQIIRPPNAIYRDLF